MGGKLNGNCSWPFKTTEQGKAAVLEITFVISPAHQTLKASYLNGL